MNACARKEAQITIYTVAVILLWHLCLIQRLFSFYMNIYIRGYYTRLLRQILKQKKLIHALVHDF